MIQKAKQTHDENYLRNNWKNELKEKFMKSEEKLYSKRTKKDSIAENDRKFQQEKYKHENRNYISPGENWLVNSDFYKQDLLYRKKIQELCKGTVSAKLSVVYKVVFHPSMLKLEKCLSEVNF